MGCFLLLRETRKTRRLYAKILDELKKPRPLHEADMRRILRRIDDMNTKLTAALTALGTSVSALAVATDAETGKLASIEEQLRNSDGLSNDETNDLADQISSITGTITASTSKLTNSLSDVHDAAGSGSGSGSGSDQGGASQGSGSSSGGDGSQSQGSGSGGDPSGGNEPGGITGQGTGSGDGSQTQAQDDPALTKGDAPQDPPQG